MCPLHAFLSLVHLGFTSSSASAIGNNSQAKVKAKSVRQKNTDASSSDSGGGKQCTCRSMRKHVKQEEWPSKCSCTAQDKKGDTQVEEDSSQE